MVNIYSQVIVHVMSTVIQLFFSDEKSGKTTILERVFNQVWSDQLFS